MKLRSASAWIRIISQRLTYGVFKDAFKVFLLHLGLTTGMCVCARDLSP